MVVAPPPRTGPGAPAVNAPQLVQQQVATGTWTLTGVGSGMYGGSDGMTVAGQSYRHSRGVFSCRLVLVAAIGGTGIADGARIGLCARSDLPDSAGEVALNVSMGRGVHVLTRPFPGASGADTKPLSHELSLGGVPVLAADDSRPMANYLLRPVWFKLVLDVNRWTAYVAYVSLDSRAWAQPFDPVGVEFLGAWVGLFATAHGGHPLRCVFDHVSGFVPNTFVRGGT